MKQLLLLLLITWHFSLHAQKSFKLKKNQNAISSTRILLLDTLILEDNSTIQIADNMTALTIIAKYAVIGNNVTIMGGKKVSGSVSGSTGADGQPLKEGNCRNGNPGENGSNGMNGQDGTDIFLYLRIVSLGSMNIQCNGTEGGTGGNGGNGSKGADARAVINSCAAQPGGRGGNGGNGGNGGKGGNVVFNYTYIDVNGRFLASQPGLSNVTYSLGGGKGGPGGKSGNKGEQGKSLTTHSLADLNKSVPDAKEGFNGQNGKNGYFQAEPVKQNF